MKIQPASITTVLYTHIDLNILDAIQRPAYQNGIWDI